MLIDCDACAARGPACGDCVVTVLLGAPSVRRRGPGRAGEEELHPDVGIDLDRRERAAIAVLAQCGLIPPLRLVTKDAVRVETWSEGPFDDPFDDRFDGRFDQRFDRRFDDPFDDPCNDPFDSREGNGRQAAG
jgi:hypothetical protein